MINVRVSRKNRIIAFLICMLAAVFMISGGISFKAKADTTGSAELICRYEDETLAGMNWRIYYAGTRSGDQYVLDGAFMDYRITHGDLTAETLTTLASTLANYAVLDNIVPDASGITDQNGSVNFKGLAPGFYLVAGDKLRIGNGTYAPAPIIIEIGEGNTDIVAYPKFTYYDVLGAETIRMRVRKIWENGDDNVIIADDASVDVEIYSDSVLVETVTLNKDNDWTYTWNGDSSATWSVLEKNIPENYTVAYRSNDSQFVVVNTLDSENIVPPAVTTTTSTSAVTTTTGTGTVTESAKTSTTAKPAVTTTAKPETKLPQTGQLWWPIPILALGGMVFVGIGFRLISRSKKEDD